MHRPNVYLDMVRVLQAQGDLGPGRTWWVGGTVAQHKAKTASNANDGFSPETPFSTLEYAIDKCTASRGDNIMVLPGFTLDLDAAADLDLDIAGMTVWGLGRGTLMPTITCSGTDDNTDIDVDAANIRLHGFAINMSGNDSVAAFIDVNASDFHMDNCRIIGSASGAGQVDIALLATAAADRMIIEDCVFEYFTDAGPTAAIQINATDRSTIKNCVIYGDFSAACIDIAAASTNVLFTGNHLENYNAVDVCIEGVASSTGEMSYNACRIATDAQVTWINTPGNCTLIENYGVNNDGETGMIVGTASS